MQTAVVNLLFGVLLLFLGRKLFWLFVGAAGFLLGTHYATLFAAGTESARLLIALAVGIICALLAVLLQKVAIAVGGFIIGAYLSVDLLHAVAAVPPSWNPVSYIIGGILGAILVVLLFDWALIFLSSLSGASLIVHSVRLHGGASPILFAGLATVGILVQLGIMRSRRTIAV